MIETHDHVIFGFERLWFTLYTRMQSPELSCGRHSRRYKPPRLLDVDKWVKMCTVNSRLPKANEVSI